MLRHRRNFAGDARGLGSWKTWLFQESGLLEGWGSEQGCWEIWGNASCWGDFWGAKVILRELHGNNGSIRRLFLDGRCVGMLEMLRFHSSPGSRRVGRRAELLWFGDFSAPQSDPQNDAWTCK